MNGRSRPLGGGPEPNRQSQGYHGLGVVTTFPLAFAGNFAPAGNKVGRPCGRPTADGIANKSAIESIARPVHCNASRAGGGWRSLAPARGAVAGGGAAGATGTVTAPLAVAWSARSLPRLSSPLREARPLQASHHSRPHRTHVHEAHARTQARTQASHHSRRFAIPRDKRE